MIFTKRHMIIPLLLVTVVFAAGMYARVCDSRRTFSSSDFKVVLDAGHGAFVKCFNRRLV